MATEIESLKATVAKLREENDSIRNLLDTKQSEWIETESKRKTSKAKAAATPMTSVVNRFDILYSYWRFEWWKNSRMPDKWIKLPILADKWKATELNRSRIFKKLKKTRQNQIKEPSKLSKRIRKEDTCHRRLYHKTYWSKEDPNGSKKQDRLSLVQRSHSWSTAWKVRRKLPKRRVQSRHNSRGKTENLIEKVRQPTERIAVSSVIRRYDSKFSESKIAFYNNLLHNLYV